MIRVTGELRPAEPRRARMAEAAVQSWLVEQGDGGQVLVIELQLEDVLEVGLDAAWRHRLGQDGKRTLEPPTEEHRLHGGRVLLGDSMDRRIVGERRALVELLHGVVGAAHRRVRGDDDLVGLAVVEQFLALIVGMRLELVHGNGLRRNLFQLLEVFYLKIRHANVPQNAQID